MSIHSAGRGLTIHATGWRFLCRHRSLWPWALGPALFQCLLFATFLWLFFTHLDLIRGGIEQFLPAPAATPVGWIATLLRSLQLVLLAVATFIAGVVVFVLGTLLTYLLGSIVGAPLYDLLSEKTETLATGRQEPPLTWARLWLTLRRTVVVELLKAIFFLAVPFALLALHLIPVIGNALAVVLTGLWVMWSVGFTFLDYPQGRRLLPWGARWRFARRHAGALLAFGSVSWLPGYLLLAAPALIVAGTLLYGELESPE